MTKTMKNASNTATQTVREKTLELTAQEEKVVRMLHGLPAPGDHVLEQVGQEFSETAARLEEIERRAIEAAGPRQNPTKRKIINSLRRKGL